MSALLTLSCWEQSKVFFKPQTGDVWMTDSSLCLQNEITTASCSGNGAIYVLQITIEIMNRTQNNIYSILYVLNVNITTTKKHTVYISLGLNTVLVCTLSLLCWLPWLLIWFDHSVQVCVINNPRLRVFLLCSASAHCYQDLSKLDGLLMFSLDYYHLSVI